MRRFGKVRVTVIHPGILPGLLVLTAAVLLYLLATPADHYASLFYGYPLKGYVIAIDPGHGGIDPGTHHNGSLTEKEVVLEVGLELRRLLEQAGAQVVMTRITDEDTSKYLPDDPADRYRRDLKGRVKVINEANADLFLSLHINSIYDPTVRGAIVYYCTRHPQNLPLAETIQKNINPVVKVNPKPEQYIHQNIKVGDYHILNHTDIPGVVVEMGFMTSPDDRSLLQQEQFRLKLAQALFLGIVEHTHSKR